MTKAFALVLLLSTLMSGSWAACSKEERNGRFEFETGWLWTYGGKVGDRSDAAITIEFRGKELRAVLFEPASRKNVRLSGAIGDDGQFELTNVEASVQLLRLSRSAKIS